MQGQCRGTVEQTAAKSAYIPYGQQFNLTLFLSSSLLMYQRKAAGDSLSAWAPVPKWETLKKFPAQGCQGFPTVDLKYEDMSCSGIHA